MDFQIQSSGSGLRVMLQGRLTFAENRDFRAMLAQIQDSGARRVVLDLGAVDFIDSAGLGMLLHTRDAMRRGSGEVCLDAASGQVSRMLDLSRMRDLFGA